MKFNKPKKPVVRFKCRRNAIIAVFVVSLFIAFAAIAVIVSAAVNSPVVSPTRGPVIHTAGKRPIPIVQIPTYEHTTESSTETTTETITEPTTEPTTTTAETTTEATTYTVSTVVTGVATSVGEICDNLPAATIDWRPMVNNGDTTISLQNTTLTRKCLPNAYYNIDFSTFQPYMDVDCITATGSAAYQLCNAYDTYSDEYGLMRKPSTGFTVDGKDDYIVALGNYYKAKGSIGDRFLVATTTGYYTIVVGDEKDDGDTDPYNMYSYHGNYAGLIEFIVQTDELTASARRMGTIHDCGNPIFAGDITRIYRIG
jgi:hypothetical protein